VNVTDAQRDALIAAGGCKHTPNPFIVCDVCGRPPITGTHGAVVSYGFVAETMDGTVLAKADHPSIEHLPLDVVRRLVVLTDDPRVPRVTLDVDPDKGERLFRFRRNIRRVAAGSGAQVAALAVEVLEVRNGDGWGVRLYLHPFQGPILSTRDLYF
jgi:hypothetical protein